MQLADPGHLSGTKACLFTGQEVLRQYPCHHMMSIIAGRLPKVRPVIQPDYEALEYNILSSMI